MAYKAAVTAPHFNATQAGEAILSLGGNAVEACIAMASTLTVVYPHMTSLGGDGFWVIHQPDSEPIAIYAAGQCAADISGINFGKHTRGAKVALTTAGAVSGWEKALSLYPGQLSLDQLFHSAINHAENGFEVTQTLHQAQSGLLKESDDADFAQVFLNHGEAFEVGSVMTIPALARTYKQLARQGLRSWYTGELAQENARYLSDKGSPITLSDIERTEASIGAPLQVSTQWGRFYNTAAPTQGGASLNIVALLDCYLQQRDKPTEYWQSHAGEEEILHYLIEAVKVAFEWRNRHLSDQASTSEWMQNRLAAVSVAEQNSTISECAKPWPNPGATGDTVWMGVVDKNGLAVSYIQSIYWEFGSGVVNPNTGVVWNNRCLGFNQDSNHPNSLRAGRVPMHTLNPPLAVLNDGSRFIYGTMGGEGQPQTQAALVWRYLVQKHSISETTALSRWLLGKTWGKASENLKLGEGLYQLHGESLKQRGHDVVSAPDMAEFFGHAGAIHVSETDTVASSDPRSNGQAVVIEKQETRIKTTNE